MEFGNDGECTTVIDQHYRLEEGIRRWDIGGYPGRGGTAAGPAAATGGKGIVARRSTATS